MVTVYHATKKKVAVFIFYVFTQSSKTFLLETYPTACPHKNVLDTHVYIPMFIYTHLLVHITEAICKGQFVKKSSDVATLTTFKNPQPQTRKEI